MRTAHLCRLAVAAATVLMITASRVASAQTPEPLEERVRQLYASADYEQALSILGIADEPMVLQYRALCLLALGRQEDAKGVLEVLVAASPEFTISAEEMPPRFVTLLSQTRRQLLPVILRRRFAEARELYQARAYDRAVPRFEQVVALSSEADVRDVDGVSDLRLLAEGFVDLAKAPQAARPQVTVSGTASPSPTPALRPTTTPPVAVRQDMPPWPVEAGTIARPMMGAVRVQIDSVGRVKSATMVKSIDPRYDTRLLAATRFWEYRPGTVNGVSTESETVVEIRVNPRR